ncbi:SseB family protein [Frankia sp. AiPs1]|uniref:SseB family protein n=1 Tax=Frankia sp. AiPs1 TaxID=573493 RepID=UPI002043E16E|nr:SseB family protein [Frankia sp. AiPs1]MCM3922774.1 SseB family protein [Frankia sp. AiPs1]
MTDDQLRPDLASAGSGAPDQSRGAFDRDPAQAGATDRDAGLGGTTTAGRRASEQGAAALDALHRLADGEDERSALGDLALADVLLPDLGNEITDLSEESEVLQLPVAERQDGTQFVPTFTSEQRLTEALPDVARYRTVQIATLGRIWPSDDLLLAVDPGSEAGIALPAEGLRALAAMSA